MRSTPRRQPTATARPRLSRMSPEPIGEPPRFSLRCLLTAIRIPLGVPPTRTADLDKLAESLQQCQIRTVAMESTGEYWIPLFQILEKRKIDVRLANAHHVSKSTAFQTLPSPGRHPAQDGIARSNPIGPQRARRANDFRQAAPSKLPRKTAQPLPALCTSQPR